MSPYVLPDSEKRPNHFKPALFMTVRRKARENGLVAQVCLVCLVHLVERNSPDKPNQPNKQNNQMNQTDASLTSALDRRLQQTCS
jgi:hypothetical protein